MGGRSCNALTSRIDLVPTSLSMAGGDESKKAELLDKLKGKDFSRLLNHPEEADLNEVHQAALYNFNMLVYEDPGFTLGVLKILGEKGTEEGPKEVRRLGLKPGFNNHRGASARSSTGVTSSAATSQPSSTTSQRPWNN